MKTPLIACFLSLVMLSGNAVTQERREVNLQAELRAEEVLEDKVRVFDYSGNLITELNADDIAQNEISLSDYLILEDSDFAFDYLGDYYYFRGE